MRLSICAAGILFAFAGALDRSPAAGQETRPPVSPAEAERQVAQAEADGVRVRDRLGDGMHVNQRRSFAALATGNQGHTPAGDPIIVSLDV